MKTRCSEAFAQTLAAIEMDYQRWRWLNRATRHRGIALRKAKATRQFIRRVQRLHTGKGGYFFGRYVAPSSH